MSSPDTQSTASWSVGELALASGLSARVLRHWQEMGLLTSDRTPSGQRRYGPAQVTRLFRALALRRTGLGLSQIAALLDEQDTDPAATLRAHLDELTEDLRRRSELRDRLANVLTAFEDSVANGVPEDQQAPILMKVIETMTMFEQYVHGYHSEENARLNDQAGTLVDLLHGDTWYPAGSAILEAGCGVGAQTVTLAGLCPTAAITCIDTSADSVREAQRRVAAVGTVNATFIEADVMTLPHANGPLAAEQFDHVFVCFLLEHLPDPAAALTRLQTMLKPGGTITVIEGDHGSTYFHPDGSAAREAIACQVALQRHAGGDALIGRRLYPLLTAAGFDCVAASPRQVYVDASRPELRDGFIHKTFAAMIQGVRQPALAAGLIDADRFDLGIRELLRTAESDGVFCYTFFKATAVKATAVKATAVNATATT